MAEPFQAAVVLKKYRIRPTFLSSKIHSLSFRMHEFLKSVHIGLRQSRSLLCVRVDGTLELPCGQLHLLVGRSGCGKSVFMGSLAGFLPTGSNVKANSYVFAGHELFGGWRESMSASGYLHAVNACCKKSEMSIVYLPQLLPPLRDLTVRQLIRQVVGGRGCRYDDKNALRLVEEFGEIDAEGLLNKDISKLSGGQRRKIELVACMQSLNNGGRCLLLLDEPTTGLDRLSACEFFGALNKVLSGQHGNDICIMLATHVPNLVRDAFNRPDTKDEHIGKLLCVEKDVSCQKASIGRLVINVDVKSDDWSDLTDEQLNEIYKGA